MAWMFSGVKSGRRKATVRLVSWSVSARAAAHGFGDFAVAQIDKRMAHGGVAEHADAQRADAALG